jgi:hypothetical protein
VGKKKKGEREEEMDGLVGTVCGYPGQHTEFRTECQHSRGHYLTHLLNIARRLGIAPALMISLSL